VAAFRAADLGIQTTLIDANPLLGGVCLREGCIPSKALLHVAHLIQSAAEAESFGVTFAAPKIDVAKLRGWKQSVVERLCGGINTLAKKRQVNVIHRRAVAGQHAQHEGPISRRHVRSSHGKGWPSSYK
jgi:dihydrolipoamide dehydrogenase